MARKPAKTAIEAQPAASLLPATPPFPPLVKGGIGGVAAGDFPSFCSSSLKIRDAKSRALVPFIFWPHQLQMAESLVNRQWIILLKARQLGITEEYAAYAVWRCQTPGTKVYVLYQTKEYAQGFIEKCAAFCRQVEGDARWHILEENKSRLALGCPDSPSVIKAIAATKRSGHSVTADLVIVEEAAFMPELKAILRGLLPSAEADGSQVIVSSTSQGPGDYFAELYRKAVAGNSALECVDEAPLRSTGILPVVLHGLEGRATSHAFRAFFFPWQAVPYRNQDWYNGVAEQNEGDPTFMQYNYPATVDQAFVSPEGRVFPLFSCFGKEAWKFVKREFDPELPFPRRVSWLPHYAGIDFGGVDPFVCLWACIWPDPVCGLTVDPSCNNLIRELSSYSFDKRGEPAAGGDHAIDALRYIVTGIRKAPRSYRLHVYRELYLDKPVARGMSIEDCGQLLVEQTGGQRLRRAWADRSRPDSMLSLRRAGFDCGPAIAASGREAGDVQEGLTRLNGLIVARAKLCRLPTIDPDESFRRDLVRNYGVEAIAGRWRRA